MTRGRACVNEDCGRALLPTEQGALCSRCYFEIITDPALADPPRPSPETEPATRWRVSERARSAT